MCRVRSYSTWNPVPWSLSGPDLMARSSGRTTSYSVSQAPETTGPRVITRRAQNSWTPCWTWCAKRARTATVCRYIKLLKEKHFNYKQPINIDVSENPHRSRYHCTSRIQSAMTKINRIFINGFIICSIITYL